MKKPFKKAPLPFDVIGYKLYGKGGKILRDEKFGYSFTATDMDTLQIFHSFIKDESSRAETISMRLKEIEASVRSDIEQLRAELKDARILR